MFPELARSIKSTLDKGDFCMNKSFLNNHRLMTALIDLLLFLKLILNS